ncbi:outer membrane protein Iml2/Tetratricopeptide repeat protein 39 [Pisolithus microcarpus]|nr:outer membrane protein Iml2/Tetratricopeptide repeat protein 39 [Pisolithus microcarpus]
MSRPPPPVPSTYTPEKALDDLPGIQWALCEFLHSRMLESEEFCDRMDPNKERLCFANGYGVIQVIKGLMSFEDKDLLSALHHMKRGTSSLAGRLAGYIVPGLSYSGPEWVAQMTDVERHAELMVLYYKSLVGIVYSGDWLSFIKEMLNMRTILSTYRQLGRYLEAADAAYTASHYQDSEVSLNVPLEDPSIDRHFRSGVYVGLGLSHLALSLMPSRILTIVEMFGYRGDRMEGLRLLGSVGGLELGRLTRTSFRKALFQRKEGLRRPMCDMSLLIFHLVLSTYTFEGVDVNLARRIVEWNLKTYPNGVFFLFGAGRLALVRSQPERALEYYAKAAQVSIPISQPAAYQLVGECDCQFCFVGCEASKEWWSRLRAEATWSKATYTYGEAACLASLGEHAAAADLMARVGDLRQRIAGKSIPLEKFTARKARKYLAQDNHLVLPAMELAYVFCALSHAPQKVVLEKMIPNIRKALEELGLTEAGCGSPGRPYPEQVPPGTRAGNGTVKSAQEGYWDNVCLTRFLEGVCWRYVAYPRAELAFKAVFEHGPKIELDHYLVYYAHFEYGRLLARSGKKDEARTHFDLVLSGKVAEVNPCWAKGQVQTRLYVRTHAAVDALEQDRLL